MDLNQYRTRLKDLYQAHARNLWVARRYRLDQVPVRLAVRRSVMAQALEAAAVTRLRTAALKAAARADGIIPRRTL